MPIHVFQKKLNYAKNISESCHNGNAKLLNVLKFYFDLKERHDKLYYTVKKYRLLIITTYKYEWYEKNGT